MTRLPCVMNEMEQPAYATPPPLSPVDVINVYVSQTFNGGSGKKPKQTCRVSPSPQLFRNVMRNRVIAPKHMLTQGLQTHGAAQRHTGENNEPPAGLQESRAAKREPEAGCH